MQDQIVIGYIFAPIIALWIYILVKSFSHFKW